jgi:2-isopropylmalate synthase
LAYRAKNVGYELTNYNSMSFTKIFLKFADLRKEITDNEIHEIMESSAITMNSTDL